MSNKKLNIAAMKLPPRHRAAEIELAEAVEWCDQNFSKSYSIR
jgi:hypothetical protein